MGHYSRNAGVTGRFLLGALHLSAKHAAPLGRRYIRESIDHTVGIVRHEQRAVCNLGQTHGPCEVRLAISRHNPLTNGLRVVGLPSASPPARTVPRFHEPRIVTSASPRYSAGNDAPVWNNSCIGAACAAYGSTIGTLCAFHCSLKLSPGSVLCGFCAFNTARIWKARIVALSR